MLHVDDSGQSAHRPQGYWQSVVPTSGSAGRNEPHHSELLDNQPENDLLRFVLGEVLVEPVVERLGIREPPRHGGQDRRRLFQPSTSSSAETASSYGRPSATRRRRSSAAVCTFPLSACSAAASSVGSGFLRRLAMPQEYWEARDPPPPRPRRGVHHPRRPKPSGSGSDRPSGPAASGVMTGGGPPTIHPHASAPPSAVEATPNEGQRGRPGRTSGRAKSPFGGRKTLEMSRLGALNVVETKDRGELYP